MSTIGVCGFGRCGSTMVMAMLDAGGIRPVEESAERSYELPGMERLADLPPGALDGRAVKLLDGITHYPIPEADWRFIWLDRDHHEQAKSFEKFVRALGVIAPSTPVDLAVIEASYVTDRPAVLTAYEALGPVLVLRYEDVLADPAAGAQALAQFVPRLTWPPAAAAVHRRDGGCRATLMFEQYGINA